MKRNFLICLIAAIFIIGCNAPANSQQEKTPGVWKWPRSTPGQQQLDTSRLEELVKLIHESKKIPRLHSLLIVRNGYLVVEEYFGGYNADKAHMLQSVSKSFNSALVGIAIEQRKFKGVDEKVLDFFPGIIDIKNMDDNKAAMRLRDLLTMRSGTDYHERGPGVILSGMVISGGLWHRTPKAPGKNTFMRPWAFGRNISSSFPNMI